MEAGFISIDCGAPNSYQNTQYQIKYETDADYVDTGENQQVSTEYIYDNDVQSDKNMRIFPNGTRNCYTVRPQKGKGNKYLIRACHFYGNYDGQNVVPVFDVYIDTNLWYTSNGDDGYCQEIIYSLSRDYVQLCLINTGNGIPLLSSLEFRLLDGGIYPFDSGALSKWERSAVGMSLQMLTYPDDVFDRYWYNYSISGAQVVNSTTFIQIDSSTNAYKVPWGVLQNAQVVSDQIRLFSSNPKDRWYIYFHFTEIEVLQKNESREFYVNVDNTMLETETLLYSTVSTVHTQMLTGQSSISFSLSPTARSTRPPILNAFEVYKVLDLTNPMTAAGDFDAINHVRRVYGLQTKEDWQGDPCSPSTFMWSRLNCSNDGDPGIISLNLSSSGLTGLIAPAFANLTSLQSLYVSMNISYLSGNSLDGSIPQDLMKKKADGTLILSLEGNPKLCNSSYCPTTTTGTRRSVIVPIAYSMLAIVVVVSLVSVAVIWRCYMKRRGGRDITQRLAPVSSASTPKVFTHSELQSMTSNFQTIIGGGSFGKVYFGRLEDGTRVAVKVLSQTSKQGDKEFQAEAKLLKVVHHRNLVTLIGYSDDPENLALVYEYMSNGNLREHLSADRLHILSWPERLQIAIDAAQGRLEYLHSGCRPAIIHRDFKTANILLDENMRAKISDFGLSRAFATLHDTHISTTPGGTPGYLDPEFSSFGNLNQKSDVYSFGIVLFELITGHPALIKDGGKLTHILQWALPLIERGDIESIMDPRLNGEFKAASAWKAVEIAMSCVPAVTSRRPDMSHVLPELKGCMVLESTPGDSQRMGTSKRSNSFKTSFQTSSLNLGMVPPDPR
ncbi:hypothetical protein MLD38_037368 [Melastoma candidum]|uniref:Uncharacterized protein n=1 Tax=Melastoma candidum TaxID=119954 RepID=A0ACB9LNK2_9MYRT|nr:hypothetical protein MLD38_037368 [Melastoma candidum]